VHRTERARAAGAASAVTAADPHAIPGVDPAQLGATPHWTITIGTPYCGGYRIGDGVYVSAEAPLALPSALPDGSVLFAGQPATVTQVHGTTLRVGPTPGLAQRMICMAGERPLTIELLPEAGFALPGDAGDYALDVWTGANPTLLNFVFSVPAVDQQQP
jgi:hypothetical protein